MSSSLEAKIVVLGSQGVGKTSLVNRYVKNAFEPAKTTSTVGASFVTKRVLDTTSDTMVRLQIWDTAGQERFRSISRLYYRGANACLLCYDITDERSFEEMTGWLQELKQNLGHSNDLFPNKGGANTEDAGSSGGTVESPLVIHVVGTKADIVTHEPWRRKVPFERTIAYTAEQLYPSRASTPPPSAGYGNIVVTTPMSGLQSPDSKRSSGFWGQDYGWDCCHEISAKDGEGVEEVFRVIARKLVEQRNKQQMTMMAATSAGASASAGATSKSNSALAKNGSSLLDPQDAETDTGRFVLGLGREYSFRGRSGFDKRRSWLSFASRMGGSEVIEVPTGTDERRQSCC